MASLAVDVDDARVAVADTGRRIAELLGGNLDPSRPVPGLTWTLGELIAHIVTEMQFFSRLAGGELTGEDMWAKYAAGLDHRPVNERMAALNAATLAELDPDDLARSDDLLRSAVGAFLSRTADWPAGKPFHGIEGDVDIATITCVVLGEMLVHGRDLGGASGTPWVIPADHARMAISGAASLLPDLCFNPAAAGDLRATIDVRVRGGPRFALWVHDGRLDVETEPTERVDCHVSADPVAFILVSFGRQGHWSAALRGQLLAWGRKPWLGLRLPRLLVSP